ncbi:hypothetical protein KLP40_10455 [Hymenobacter sp. NST-14]|uniref:Ig-like domain-containing protein n=1 Tax=Hymenobacter piscis TaxID=2839984 RepID=UPI001C01E4B8|nr:Ig-like domain-containing protein [Hymenobacter piscis]MBT9393583.1 hypothetical protein [Hymenobacter piscis]
MTKRNLAGARRLSFSAAALLLLNLLPAPVRAQGQYPTNITYAAPITITQGGTYTGNFRSTDSNTPCIRIQTTQPVTITGCVLVGAGNLIDAKNGGSTLVITNNKGYGIRQSVDNRRHGRFLEVNTGRSVRVENNYFEHTSGIAAYQWSGDGSASQTLTVRYNQAKNIDGRFRNGGGEYVQFCGLNQVRNVGNIQISWNQVINEPNNSLVEDNINFYNSGGTAQSPARVHNNYVQGAYPYPANGSKFTGTGMTTDGDGSSASTTAAYIEAAYNQFISTCNAAMNIAAGHDIYYHDNRMVTSALLPDGSPLNATYAATAIFNAYQQPSSVFYGNRTTNNTIGFVKNGYKVPFANRHDLSSGACANCTGTTHLPNPITLQTEQGERNLWQQKLQQNNIKIGADGTNTGTTTPPTTNQAPTVSLAAASSSVIVNSALALTATAADADGSVSKVEFFSGSTKLGEDTAAPYTLSFSPAATGTLSLTARATDNAGATKTSAPVSVTVTAAPVATTPPTTFPGPTGATFLRGININGTAVKLDNNQWEAASGAANVSVRGTNFRNPASTPSPAVDATRADMLTSAVGGTTVGATIGGLSNGTYSVYAYIWEDNNPETTNILVNGQTVRTGYNTGSAGRWERLGPFQVNVTGGSIALTTSGGHPNLSGVEVWKHTTTSTNQAPTVSLAAASSSVIVNSALALTATAADADGSVSKVEFFSGSTKLGEDTAAPYTLSFSPAATGTLSLTARATDNAGATKTSAPVSVTVTAAPVAAATFFRAINLNGSALTVDGNAWQSSSAGGYSTNGQSFANQGVTLAPSTTTARAQMIRSSVYSRNLTFTMNNVPNGEYEVYAYLWEDNNAQTVSLSLNGKSVLSNYNTGSAGTWKKVGPYAVTVTNGAITLNGSGGDLNLSGVEVWSKKSGTAFQLNPFRPTTAALAAVLTPAPAGTPAASAPQPGLGTALAWSAERQRATSRVL